MIRRTYRKTAHVNNIKTNSFGVLFVGQSLEKILSYKTQVRIIGLILFAVGLFLTDTMLRGVLTLFPPELVSDSSFGGFLIKFILFSIFAVVLAFIFQQFILRGFRMANGVLKPLCELANGFLILAFVALATPIFYLAISLPIKPLPLIMTEIKILAKEDGRLMILGLLIFIFLGWAYLIYKSDWFSSHEVQDKPFRISRLLSRGTWILLIAIILSIGPRIFYLNYFEKNLQPILLGLGEEAQKRAQGSEKVFLKWSALSVFGLHVDRQRPQLKEEFELSKDPIIFWTRAILYSDNTLREINVYWSPDKDLSASEKTNSISPFRINKPDTHTK